MGKFDGFLICTDWDGSFASGRNVSPDNVKAVQYFQENGGLFTVATGRYADHIGSFREFVIPNTYLITLNGSMIVHHETGKVLSQHTTGPALFPILHRILDRFPHPVKVVLYPTDANESVSYPREEYLEKEAELSLVPSFKILFVTDLPENGLLLRNIALEETEGSPYECSRSWPVGLEFFCKSGNKGNACLAVKKAVGAKTLVCIGDFENDMSMLKVADIPCSVANGIPAVKELASYVAKRTAPEGAVAEIIEMLEEKYLQ